MSIFADYKAYKKYEPSYERWKYNRDLADAKRQEYLRQNPDKITQKDILKGRALIRAIDVMDEYSQKRAEDIELAVDSVLSYLINAALFLGLAVGAAVGKLKPVQNLLDKYLSGSKEAKIVKDFLPMAVGALIGMFASIPLYTWGAKTEVSASRRGRFEAMRKDLKNPNAFAILNDEQFNDAKKISKNIVLKDESKPMLDFLAPFRTLTTLAKENKEYLQQKKRYELEIKNAEKHLNDEITVSEAESAKNDQQLLTKLVEKIDIASQDYAENAELATQTLTSIIVGFGTLFNIVLSKVLSKMNVKSTKKISAITNILTVSATLGFGIISTQIQKQASRVGRFKVKQDLLKNPEKLTYVPDKNIVDIKDIPVKKEKKENIFKFLVNAWKNNKEYEQYKKTIGKEEEKFYKALEQIELSPEQLKEAKRIQSNTFKTFNKVDEKSQKYSESIEALGQSLMVPIMLISTTIGSLYATRQLIKCAGKTPSLEGVSAIAKYVNTVILSMLPAIGIDILITKEQKKASRIADMLAINELSDYRQFR